MKRDMDLIRDILLSAESNEHGYIYKNPELPGFTTEQVDYHVHLLKQAGLVDALESKYDQAKSPSAVLAALTWQGHEFIESARSQTVWNQAKGLFHKAGGGSFQLWQSVLTDLVKNSLGIG